jgi:hypothetical protein
MPVAAPSPGAPATHGPSPPVARLTPSAPPTALKPARPQLPASKAAKLADERPEATVLLSILLGTAVTLLEQARARRRALRMDPVPCDKLQRQ